MLLLRSCISNSKEKAWPGGVGGLAAAAPPVPPAQGESVHSNGRCSPPPALGVGGHVSRPAERRGVDEMREDRWQDGSECPCQEVCSLDSCP